MEVILLIISHRGNTDGPNSAYYGENHPSSIKNVLWQKFDCEIDCWFIENKFVLGHDKGEHEITQDFFYNDKLWVHCKNIEALYQLIDNPCVNAFFHDKDDAVLTSKKFIWTYPKNLHITNRSIAVLPELVEDWDFSKAHGICTDFYKKYSGLFS